MAVSVVDDVSLVDVSVGASLDPVSVVVVSALASALLPPVPLPPVPLPPVPPSVEPPLPPVPLPPVPPSLPLAPPVPLVLLLLQPLVITIPPASSNPPENTSAARPLPSFLNISATNSFRRSIKVENRSLLSYQTLVTRSIAFATVQRREIRGNHREFRPCQRLVNGGFRPCFRAPVLR